MDLRPQRIRIIKESIENVSNELSRAFGLYEATPQPQLGQSMSLKQLSKSMKEPKTPALTKPNALGLDLTFMQKYTMQKSTLLEAPHEESEINSPSAFDMAMASPGALSHRYSRQKSTLASLQSNAIKRDMLMRKMTNPLQFFKEDLKENQFEFHTVIDKLSALVNYNRIIKHWATQS